MTSLNSEIIKCARCIRLRKYCAAVAQEKKRAYLEQTYWGKPVPNFGEGHADLLVVGLAPAAHGANRTGRMFTGDRSGDWLYRALHKFDFASQAHSVSGVDGLKLKNCVITAVAHCAPPQNKPTPEEIKNCDDFLQSTFVETQPRAVLALGSVAFKAVLAMTVKLRWTDRKASENFQHGLQLSFPGGQKLFASYHPSQQNTFTRVLTEPMFDAVFANIQKFLENKRKN